MELVDTLDLGSSFLKVWVQVPSSLGLSITMVVCELAKFLGIGSSPILASAKNANFK